MATDLQRARALKGDVYDQIAATRVQIRMVMEQRIAEQAEHEQEIARLAAETATALAILRDPALWARREAKGPMQRRGGPPAARRASERVAQEQRDADRQADRQRQVERDAARAEDVDVDAGADW